MLHGTEFADHESVFDDAWNHILSAIVIANKYKIGVLLGKDPITHMRFCFFKILRSLLPDLHAAPGKQVRTDH